MGLLSRSYFLLDSEMTYLVRIRMRNSGSTHSSFGFPLPPAATLLQLSIHSSLLRFSPEVPLSLRCHNIPHNIAVMLHSCAEPQPIQLNLPGTMYQESAANHNLAIVLSNNFRAELDSTDTAKIWARGHLEAIGDPALRSAKPSNVVWV
jgi:hypothetical protein